MSQVVDKRSYKHKKINYASVYKQLSEGLPWWLSGKESTFSAEDLETWVQSLGQEDPLEEGMANHSSNLAWKIPWT